jgi:adenylate cyclase
MGKNALSASEASALAAASLDWLVESGLAGGDLPELVAGLGRRLDAGGMAVDRVGCAVLTLHPQIVSHEATWRPVDERATTQHYTSKMMEDPSNRQGPYFDLALNGHAFKRYFLTDGRFADNMPLLNRLRAEGFTEYFGFFCPTGGAAAVTPFARRLGLVPCVVGSFATRRPDGFNEIEISGLKSISRTLALAAKSRMNFETGSRLLEIYLGHATGSQVLHGRITRGDSERIPCGILLCDLRGSTRLVSQLPLEDYVALLNKYFDVTVEAVSEGGGDVLKFMGDAILGIFRSEDPDRDVDMRKRALTASMKALGSVRELRASGQPLEAVIALHVGEVMYGNVGAEERLDFTVIGQAVNETARLQELTKQLGYPVLASLRFVAPIRDRFDFVGTHAVSGLDEMIATFVPVRDSDQ